jgi:hypothetical protein
MTFCAFKAIACARWVSLLGAAMSAMYSTLAFGTSVAAGSEGANYGPRLESTASLILGAFNALGTIMFAFGGHAILLEVQVGTACLLITAALPHNISHGDGGIRDSVMACSYLRRFADPDCMSCNMEGAFIMQASHENILTPCPGTKHWPQVDASALLSAGSCTLHASKQVKM